MISDEGKVVGEVRICRWNLHVGNGNKSASVEESWCEWPPDIAQRHTQPYCRVSVASSYMMDASAEDQTRSKVDSIH